MLCYFNDYTVSITHFPFLEPKGKSFLLFSTSSIYLKAKTNIQLRQLFFTIYYHYFCYCKGWSCACWQGPSHSPLVQRVLRSPLFFPNVISVPTWKEQAGRVPPSCSRQHSWQENQKYKQSLPMQSTLLKDSSLSTDHILVKVTNSPSKVMSPNPITL